MNKAEQKEKRRTGSRSWQEDHTSHSTMAIYIITTLTGHRSKEESRERQNLGSAEAIGETEIAGNSRDGVARRGHAQIKQSRSIDKEGRNCNNTKEDLGSRKRTDLNRGDESEEEVVVVITDLTICGGEATGRKRKDVNIQWKKQHRLDRKTGKELNKDFDAVGDIEVNN